MNILLLNGSPKKENSDTLKITDAFLGGLCEENAHEISRVIIGDKDIKPCNGCFGCWYFTPGKCVIADDMAELLPAFRAADIVIWSFPLYIYGVPSGLKAFMDRTLPNCLPFIVETEEGGNRHPSRFEVHDQRHVLISTCGFHSAVNNYEALEKQFEAMLGPSIVKILLPAGGVLSAKEPSRPVRAYLERARNAGRAYSGTGTLSPETQKALAQPIYDPTASMLASNILHETAGPEENPDPKPLNAEAIAIMNKLLSDFTPETAGKTPVVIDICLTDLGNTWQLRIADGRCSLNTVNRAPYTTRLEIPFPVWKEIALGRLSISKAFLSRQFRLLGDFNTVLRFDDFFPILP
jgi:putative NADPH-quinone reductase